MRPELVVGAGAALLIGALAGMEWWAEHHWSAADAIVRPAAAGSPFGEIPDPGVPETREGEAPEASASPRLTR
jgi:hypothetical protein